MNEMIEAAEANIRADYSSGRISKEQFQKEMLFISTARYHERQSQPKSKKSFIGTGLAALIRRLFCRHQWNPTRYQPLVPGTSYECTKCGIMEHRDR